MTYFKNDYTDESIKLAIYDRISRTVGIISVLFFILFAASFISHDPAVNPEVKSFEEIEALTIKIWLALISFGSFFAVLSLFISKKRIYFINHLYKSLDVARAVENDWCPRCIGLQGSSCSLHISNKASFRQHGILKSGGGILIRKSKDSNPILYRYQQDQINKTLNKITSTLEKTKIISVLKTDE